jgi:hypothetical protein
MCSAIRRAMTSSTIPYFQASATSSNRRIGYSTIFSSIVAVSTSSWEMTCQWSHCFFAALPSLSLVLAPGVRALVKAGRHSPRVQTRVTAASSGVDDGSQRCHYVVASSRFLVSARAIVTLRRDRELSGRWTLVHEVRQVYLPLLETLL